MTARRLLTLAALAWAAMAPMHLAQAGATPQAEVVASLSIIYDHAAHTLAQELTHLQHEDHHAVLCSQHVHLDLHRCLEVILMAGTGGVKAGKLTLMSTNV